MRDNTKEARTPRQIRFDRIDNMWSPFEAQAIVEIWHNNGTILDKEYHELTQLNNGE